MKNILEIILQSAISKNNKIWAYNKLKLEKMASIIKCEYHLFYTKSKMKLHT